MLIHITPTFFLKYSNVSVELIDVTIPELGIELQAHTDITVRFPSRNRRLNVVCRKKGTRAVYGILLETDKPVSAITVLTRWLVNGEVSMHRVHMCFTGQEEAATDCISLWRGIYKTAFTDRSPAGTRSWVPSACQPMLSATASDVNSQRETAIWRKVDGSGIIREQNEYFPAATVEGERIFSGYRMPRREDAFPCKVREYPQTLQVTFENGLIEACNLDEQASLIAEDLTAIGVPDMYSDVFRPLIDEIKPLCPLFFTNTNQLMTTIKRFSRTFTVLSEDQKRLVENQFTQPLFHITTH
ncbi:DUF6012 family protein [Candidatus Pantoea multigeneris]|uniref:Uncharacterized protein n=1 Tax=Candidatus Pantoea multigeneris TaxID=2608357 RepID=A0ABX0REY4_9GAMM|nr:DUF6012 family protein [Pantoea multigeneris]NIF23931.1 hypothetical protein [Pantoea multigeneris]